ncbi:MAG: 2,3-bisphosphoglycerate-independent phosphoglycerate mutase [Patescibacteria group bacterium]
MPKIFNINITYQAYQNIFCLSIFINWIMMKLMKPIILAIIDGWGINPLIKNNPLTQAKIPNFRGVEKNYPACSLQSSGIAVGLPWNEAGNSEIGHLTIGSGQIVYQYLPRISLDIKDGTFFKNPAFVKAINHIRKNNSVLHLLGLVSSGNVHSYLEHIYGLLELARRENLDKVYLHLFTDGKDAPLKEGVKIISNLQMRLKNPNWKIATLIGRFFAMDRNSNWDRTEKAYNLMTQGVGEKTQDPVKKLEGYYQQGLTDTYIEPIVVVSSSPHQNFGGGGKNQEPIGLVKDNDAIIFFNFREDSARQITQAFISERFDKFPRQFIKNLFFCAMTQYEKGLPIEVAYPPIEIKHHLTEILSQAGKKVLKIAETEKYAHTTYFFNGGKETLYPGETRQLIPSKIVSHYEENPEMQADRVTEAVIKGIKDKYDLIVVNYANPDMIAHTGNFEAAIKTAEIIDKNIGRVIGLAESGECILIITSDHGHIEEMINLQTGEPITKHNTNPVPFYLVGKEFRLKKAKTKEEIEKLYRTPQGILCDIAPTILDLMKIPQPSEMTGASLLGILR